MGVPGVALSCYKVMNALMLHAKHVFSGPDAPHAAHTLASPESLTRKFGTRSGRRCGTRRASCAARHVPRRIFRPCAVIAAGTSGHGTNERLQWQHTCSTASSPRTWAEDEEEEEEEAEEEEEGRRRRIALAAQERLVGSGRVERARLCFQCMMREQQPCRKNVGVEPIILIEAVFVVDQRVVVRVLIWLHLQQTVSRGVPADADAAQSTLSSSDGGAIPSLPAAEHFQCSPLRTCRNASAASAFGRSAV